MSKMRIQYNSITVDIDRDFNTYLDKKFVNNAVVQSASGLEQTVNFFTQQKIRASMRLVTAQKKQELDEWFDFVKDGTAFKFWRDYNLGTYINFEGKSLKTNDGDAGTFAITEVTDAAYYLDPSTGLQTTVGVTGTDSNTPRFPAGKYGSGVLIEGARTNLCTHPSDFNNAAWVKGANITVSDNNTTETLDPIGTNIADKLTTSGGTRTLTFTTSTAISTNDSVFSVLAKSPTGEVDIVLAIEGTSGGQESSGTLNVVSNGQDGNGFTRYSVTHENDASLTGNWRYVIVVENSLDLYLFGANMEAGTDVLFPTNLIAPTLTASTTRNAESLTYLTTDVVNQDKGTISFWFTPGWIFDKHGSVVLFHSGVDTTNRHLTVVFDSTGNFSTTMYKLNGSTFESVTGSGSTIVQNAAHHYVLTYDSTVSNGLKNYLDASLLATSSNAAFSASGIGTNFAIGSFNNGNNPAFCVFDDFEIYKDVKDASWVNQRFNQNRGTGLGRNRFDNMLLDSYKTTERNNGFYDIELTMREQLS